LRELLQSKEQKRLNSIIMLTACSIWRERNGRIFEGTYNPIQQIIDKVKYEARQWAFASGGRFLLPENMS
jgi:hypothetical protein